MLCAARRAAAARRCSTRTATALLVRLQHTSSPTGGQHQQQAAAAAGAAAAHRRRAAASSASVSGAATTTTTTTTPRDWSDRHRILFLGTPDVAADVLDALLRASTEPGADFRVVGVVTQPGKPRGRGNRAVPLPSPVEAAAAAARRRYEEAGGPASGLPPPPVVLTPPNARDAAFYEALAALGAGEETAGAAAAAAADGGAEADGRAATAATEAAATPTEGPGGGRGGIDLAVTAAYGHILPQRFLDLPRHGTLNIHPSLLPKYRGAAPVPRAVEAGDADAAAVSLAFTVLRCDAGPVLACRRAAPPGTDEPAPELLARLFAEGARLLLEHLPVVWAGGAAAAATPQDERAATHAPKMRKEEGELAFGALGSRALHNRVRAFSGWPGTSGSFLVAAREAGEGAAGGGGGERVQLKVVRTALPAQGDCERARGAIGNGGGSGQSGGGGTESGGTDSGGGMKNGGGGMESGGGGGAAPPSPPGAREVVFLDGGKRMLVPCGWEAGDAASSTSWLEVLELQPPGKKAMAPRDVRNGLIGKGRRLFVEPGTGYAGPPGGTAAAVMPLPPAAAKGGKEAVAAAPAPREVRT